MGAAYSSLGRTKVLYATSLVLRGAKAKFLQRKPSVLVALEEISEMCWPQSILSEMVMPRYFADWTFSKVWLWRKWSKRICLRCWCRVTLIEWHLATFNFICQSASHCPKLVRYSCRIKQFWMECMFLYRTRSSANRQTEDLILFGRAATIQLPHDTIRITILASRYHTYRDTFWQLENLRNNRFFTLGEVNTQILTFVMLDVFMQRPR